MKLAVVVWLAAFACMSAHAAPCETSLSLSERQCNEVRRLLLPEKLPEARGNAVADNPEAAALGFRLFFDARLSSVPEMRCASCHLPESYFHDHLKVAKGKRLGTRNSPSLLNAAWLNDMFWDGRADTVWSQPLFAIENPDEMDSSRLALAHYVATNHRERYEKVFGRLPDISDPLRFPERGKPGDSSYDAMNPSDKGIINRIVANVGKSFEAYLRKIAAGRSALDRYLLGDEQALDSHAKRGLRVFVQAGCIACHSGPMLTDEQYRNEGVPLLPGARPDFGRAAGKAVLAANPFNAQGDFFDHPDSRASALSVKHEASMRPAARQEVGAFKTPSLRNIAVTAPYGHNGYFADLPALVKFHSHIPLNAADHNDLIVFLLNLNGRYPPRPWGDWPDR